MKEVFLEELDIGSIAACVRIIDIEFFIQRNVRGWRGDL